MKKLLVRLFIALVIVIVLAVVAVGLFLDSAIKKGVETIGPRITKVDVNLDGVSLSLLSGSSKIKGLVVGNPEGYKTSEAISVGGTSVSVSLRSLLSDKIVVRSIRVESPQITFELGPGGNNLKRIQENVASTTGGSGGTSDTTTTASQKPAKKLQVDEVVITGGKITVGIAALGGKVVTAPLPDIHLTDLGTGPDGITASELTKRILTAVTDGSIKVAMAEIANLGKGAAAAAASEAGKTATESLGKATKGVSDLLRKKQ